MQMYWRCWLCLALCCVVNTESVLFNDEDTAYVSASIDVDKKYVVDVLIGSPPYRCSLRVDVTTEGIEIELPDDEYTMVQSHPRYISTVHTDEGTDVVFMTGFSYIDSVRYVPQTSTAAIGVYRGTIGLGKRSILWRYWNNVEITSRYIKFGTTPQTDFLAGTNIARVPMVDCLSITNSLCQFYGTIDNSTYILDFFNNQRAFYVPRDVYMRYVEDRSLYENTVEIDDIIVRMYDHSSEWDEKRCVDRFKNHGFANIDSCKDDYVFTLERDMYISTRDRGRIKTNLLLQSTELYNNTAIPVFSFPTHVLSHVSLYLFRGADWQFDMVIKPYSINSTQTTTDMVIWGIGFILYALYITSYKFFVPVATVVPPKFDSHASTGAPRPSKHKRYTLPPPVIYVHANHDARARDMTIFGVKKPSSVADSGSSSNIVRGNNTDQENVQRQPTLSMRISSSIGPVSSFDADTGVHPGMQPVSTISTDRRAADMAVSTITHSIVFHVIVELLLYIISAYLTFPTEDLLAIGINSGWIIHSACIAVAIATCIGTLSLLFTFAAPHPTSSRALILYYTRRMCTDTSVLVGFWIFWIRLREGTLGMVAIAITGIVYIYRSVRICTGVVVTSYHYRHGWRSVFLRGGIFVSIAGTIIAVVYAQSIYPYIFSLLGLYTDTIPILTFMIASGTGAFAIFKSLDITVYIQPGVMRQLEKIGAVAPNETELDDSDKKSKKE